MRSEFLPFAQPLLGHEEIDEVVQCLRSGWLTTGHKTKQFEREFQGLRQEMGGTLQTLRVGLGEMDFIEQRGMTMLLTLDANGEVASLKQVEEAGS